MASLSTWYWYRWVLKCKYRYSTRSGVVSARPSNLKVCIFYCSLHFPVATSPLFWLASARGRKWRPKKKVTAGRRVLIRHSVGLRYQRAPRSLPITANVIPKLIFSPWYLAVSLIRVNYVHWARISCSQPLPFILIGTCVKQRLAKWAKKCRH